jgi:hypothetical protein
VSVIARLFRVLSVLSAGSIVIDFPSTEIRRVHFRALKKFVFLMITLAFIARLFLLFSFS